MAEKTFIFGFLFMNLIALGFYYKKYLKLIENWKESVSEMK